MKKRIYSLFDDFGIYCLLIHKRVRETDRVMSFGHPRRRRINRSVKSRSFEVLFRGCTCVFAIDGDNQEWRYCHRHREMRGGDSE